MVWSSVLARVLLIRVRTGESAEGGWKTGRSARRGEGRGVARRGSNEERTRRVPARRPAPAKWRLWVEVVALAEEKKCVEVEQSRNILAQS